MLNDVTELIDDENYNHESPVYEAENKVFYYNGKQAAKADFKNDIEVQNFINYVKKSDYTKTHWPKFAAGHGPDVRPDIEFIMKGISGARTGLTYSGQLQLMLTDDEEMFTLPTILHELAHAVDIRENGNPQERGDMDGHGPIFAGLFVTLVREFYSKAAGDALRAQFDQDNVPYIMPS